MSRLAFLFRTDVHAADRSPASWKGDYPSEIFSSLEQIGNLARDHKVDAVLDGGDFFHVKTAVRNSHALIVRTIATHAAYPCPVYCIEGNHDITGNNLGTIGQQPLGVLYAAGVFRHLREEVFRQGSLQVRVVGMPYSPSRDLREIQELRKKPGDTHLIAVVHALAAEDPPAHVEEFFGEPVFSYRSLVFASGPDVFMFGHWHKDQGIVSIDGRYFVNQGAVSRGALTKDNTDRSPKVSIVEISDEGIRVTEHPLRVSPAEEVFDFERKDREDREVIAINQFVEQIQQDLKVDVAENVETTIGSLNFAPEVRSRALAYLERARGL